MLGSMKLRLLVDCIVLSFLIFGHGANAGKCPLNPKRQINVCISLSQGRESTAKHSACGGNKIHRTLQCLNKMHHRCINRVDRSHTMRAILKTIKLVNNAKALCNLTQSKVLKQGCVDREWEECTSNANMAYKMESEYSSPNAPSLDATCSFVAKLYACTQRPMRECSADVVATTRASTEDFHSKKCGNRSPIPTVRQRTDIVKVKLLGPERTGNTENEHINTNPDSPSTSYVQGKEEEEEEESKMSFDDEYRVKPGAVVAGAARSSGNLDSVESRSQDGPENGSTRIATWSWPAIIAVYLTLIAI